MTERSKGAGMIKTTIGLIAVAASFAFGCGDSSSPTEPPPGQPTPAASHAPVVESVERGRLYRSQWVLRGANFRPEPKVTFESGGLVIHLQSDNFSDDYAAFEVPLVTAPGTYTPCVKTVNGKGCGNFLVTVTR
jgi:hypothetical protein